MQNHELINPLNAEIIRQYHSVAGALNIMFKEMSVRTNGELWRLENSPYFGMGSCTHADREVAEWGVEGPAAEDMIKLRDERNKQIPGESRCCPYHREGRGCTLGDLKGPVCLEHIDNPGEIEKTFGIDPYQLTHQIRWVLRKILLGEANELFVKAAVVAANSMSEHVKIFPILHPEEVVE